MTVIPTSLVAVVLVGSNQHHILRNGRPQVLRALGQDGGLHWSPGVLRDNSAMVVLCAAADGDNMEYCREA